jgi:hypothetical protein
MKMVLVRFAMVGFALCASVGAASAQLSLGVGAGPAFPVSGLDGYKQGYQVQGMLSLSLPLLPIGVRGDLLFQSLPDEAATAARNYRQVGATLNATLDVLPIPLFPVRPYLLGGAGFFRHGATGAESTDPLLVAGAGVRVGLPGLRVLAEGRLQSVNAEDGRRVTIPLIVGLSF